MLTERTFDTGEVAINYVESAATGPLLQGLGRPRADLSRGASVDDVIHVAAMVALQAASPPEGARA